MRVGKLVTGHQRGNPALFPSRLSVTVGRGKKSLRRLHAVADKLKVLPHLDEAERLLYACGLLATPDER